MVDGKQGVTTIAFEPFPDDSGIYRDLIVQTTRCTTELVIAAGNHLSSAEQEHIKSILNRAFRLAEAWCAARQLLLVAAPLMEMKGQRADWIGYLARAAALCKQRSDDEHLGECQVQIALLYRLLSQFDSASHYADAAADSFARCGNLRQRAIALAERAWIEKEQKNYAAATKSIEETLALLTMAGSDIETDVEIANYHRVRGTIALDQSQYLVAEPYYRKALDGFQRHSDRRRTAWSLNNLGLVLNRQQRYHEAIPYYQQAAALMEELGDVYHLAVLRFNQGQVYSELRQYAQALSYYHDAETIFTELNHTVQLHKLQTDIGLSALALDHYAEAILAFQVSINLAISLHHDSGRLNAMDGLGMVYLAKQEWDAAIRLFSSALADLPLIEHAPNYKYLKRSLQQHLEEAKRGGDSGSVEQ